MAEDEQFEQTSANSDEVTQENVTQPVSEVEQLKTENAELKDKYLRALAEFENYKKRSFKERSELLKYQGERLIVDLLEVVDNFERALSAEGTAAAGTSSTLKEGVELIYKLLIDTLNRWEVKGESAIGKPFDPALYKALTKVPLHDTPPNTIINENKKAYFYKDKLLRFGEVIVSSEVKE